MLQVAPSPSSAPSLTTLYKWATVATLPALLANLVLENTREQRADTTCYIQRLSTDVIVDCLFPFLCVEEIVSLRRVNKLFFILTHEPIVWQRILRGLSIPAPPLSTKYRPGYRIPGHEAEQIVTRAVTVDDRFRDDKTQLSGSFEITIPEMILEVKLLLGGKYMVASLGRPSNGKPTYALGIINVEAHASGAGTIVAMSEDLESRAYGIDAKYMRLNEEDGIMITHVRRYWSPNPAAIPGQPQDISVEDMPFVVLDDVTYDAYSGEKYPQEFDCVCTFVAIEDLEQLMDPDVHSHPGYYNIFTKLHEYHSTLRMYEPTLFEMNGAPHVSLTEQPRYTPTSRPPDRVVILRIGSRKPPTTLILEKMPLYLHWMHRIRQIRVLPRQGQILAIRSVYKGKESMSEVEIYDFPPMGQVTVATRVQNMPIGGDRAMRNFHLSEDFYLPATYNMQQNHDTHPPFSIFIVTHAPQSIMHYLLWPTKVEDIVDDTLITTRKYRLEESICLQSIREASGGMNMRVVPGVSRALIWGHDVYDRKENPTTLTFHRYVSKEVGPIIRSDWTERPQENMLSRGRNPIPSKAYSVIENLNINTVPSLFEKGISCISWDETIGRACVLCGEGNRVTVLDIAKTESQSLDHSKVTQGWQR